MFWYIFGNNNWHDGGNLGEQYARTVSSTESFYIHGAKSKKILNHNKLQIIPRTEQRVLQAFEYPTFEQKIAIFCLPNKLCLGYLRSAKDKGIKTVYMCVDDWALWKNNDWYDREVEKQMVAEADLSTATSKKMSEVLKTRYLPNACQPIMLNGNKNSTVGFLGDVDNQVSSAQFDMDLVVYLANALPNIEFELMGSRRKWSLPKNITIQCYEQWEKSLHKAERFSIGLIPYKGQDISGVQPTKSWEYMLLGIPQVAAKGLDLPSHNSVYSYTTYDECLEIIKDLLEKKTDRNEIIIYALENTWEVRLKKILEWLKQ